MQKEKQNIRRKTTKKDIKSIAKDIVVFLPTLDLEVDMLRHAEDLTKDIKIPAVGDIATVQIALQDGDIIAIAAFVSQQNIRKDIPTSEDDDLFLLDGNDEDEKYDLDNELDTKDFWNCNID